MAEKNYTVTTGNELTDAFKTSMGIFNDHYQISMDGVRQNMPEFQYLDEDPGDQRDLQPNEQPLVVKRRPDGGSRFIFSPVAANRIGLGYDEVGAHTMGWLREEVMGHERGDYLQDSVAEQFASAMGKQLVGRELDIPRPEPAPADFMVEDEPGVLDDFTMDELILAVNATPEDGLEQMAPGFGDFARYAGSSAAQKAAYENFESAARDDILRMDSDELREQYGLDDYLNNSFRHLLEG